MTEPRALTSVEQLSFGARLLRIFTAPRRTFEAIADGGSFPDWAGPVGLVAIIWAAHNFASMPFVAPENPAALASWEGLTEEQRVLATQGLEVWRSHGWFTMPLVTSFSLLAVVSLVLLGISRWLLRADLTLRQTLTIKAYASLVAIPQWVLLTFLVRAGDSTMSPQSFTFGALWSDPTASLAGRFLSALSVFDLWQSVVIGIGLSVMAGQPAKRTVGILVALWLAWAAFGALAPAPPPQTPAAL